MSSTDLMGSDFININIAIISYWIKPPYNESKFESYFMLTFSWCVSLLDVTRVGVGLRESHAAKHQALVWRFFHLLATPKQGQPFLSQLSIK